MNYYRSSGLALGVARCEQRGHCCFLQVRLIAEVLVAVGVTKTAVKQLLDHLFPASVLRESFAPPGSRTLGRLASWTKDAEGKNIPELALNQSLLAEMFLQMFASGLGTLALVWATVVLLGGFSTMLARTDFWFITVIVFVETTRIIGYNSGPEAKFFVDVPTALSQTFKILGRLTAGTAFFAEAPIVAALACIALSITGLVGIARRHYGGPNVTDASNGNLKPALVLFYALVLTQGALFFFWFAVARNRWVLAEKLKEYFEHTEVIKFMDGIKLMDRYVTATLDTCIEKGVVSTLNRTLVTFAGELLQSEYTGDHGSAVSVLYVVITRKERTAGVVNQICASEKFADRLFQLIRLKGPLDQDTKAHTAKIVAKLACNLRLEDIPEAAPSISSMLHGRLMETAAKTECQGENQIIIDTDGGPKGKPLFVHGLMILGELAGDPENCRAIYQTPDLVPKIVAPISHGLPKFVGNDSKTVQIVRASLVVVAKLTRDAGETSTKLRSRISEDKRISENLLWILQKSDGMMKSNGDHDMEILALEVLTRLSLGDATGGFIGVLGNLLTPSHDQDSPLKIPAVRALNALAADQATCQLIIGRQGRRYSLIQKLVNIMRNDANVECKAVTAELLAQICANSMRNQDRERLKPVSGSLSAVLQAFFDERTNYANLLKELRDINAEIANYEKRRKELQSILSEPPGTEFDVGELQAILAEPPRIQSLVKLPGATRLSRYKQVKICDKRIKEISELIKEQHAIRDKTAIHTKFSRRFVSSFLALALEICDKLAVTAEALTQVLAMFEMDDRAFARELMEMLQTHDDDADFACLEIVKTTIKLATWMMRTNSSYILYFQQEKVIEKLNRAMQAMRDLERDMLLTGRTDEPLHLLVKNARILVWPQQR